MSAAMTIDEAMNLQWVTSNVPQNPELQEALESLERRKGADARIEAQHDLIAERVRQQWDDNTLLIENATGANIGADMFTFNNLLASMLRGCYDGLRIEAHELPKHNRDRRGLARELSIVVNNNVVAQLERECPAFDWSEFRWK